MNSNVASNDKPDFDQPIKDIANYVNTYEVSNPLTFDNARYCLMDSIGSGLLALGFPECSKHLGPIVQGTSVPLGVRVPGTQFEMDPIKAAFDIGCCIRWLDFNDIWQGTEWVHPSDNLGGILAIADYISRRRIAGGYEPLVMKDVLLGMIKAYEIQGVLVLENNFNQVGLDHVVLVKIASTAVVTHMLGGSPEEIMDSISQAVVDGQSLRTYREKPNTADRKSWAAADATSRAVRLAMITMTGESSCPSALSATEWGFYDVLFNGKTFEFKRPFTDYVMNNILFKVPYAAEFHAQTAIECALSLHAEVLPHLNQISRVELTTNESAIRIISKHGELHHSADREHCLQYIVAIALIFGDLQNDCYSNKFAADTRIDKLREKMLVTENQDYSRDYHDPEKRSSANAIQVFFTNGTSTEKVQVEYSLGHNYRRAEGIPALLQKFESNVGSRFPKKHTAAIIDLCNDKALFETTPVNEFMDLLVI